MGLVLIWPNIPIITMGVNVVFEVILASTKVRHRVKYRKVIVQTKIVTSNIQLQMICEISVLFEKWNSHAKFIQRSHMTNQNPIP